MQRNISKILSGLSGSKQDSTTVEMRVKRSPSARSENKSHLKSLSRLEDLVQCGICFFKLWEPRMLPCQHTFCLNCLQSNFAAHSEAEGSEKSKWQCPSCDFQLDIDTPEQFEKLPTNFYIDSLLTVIDSSTYVESFSPRETSCIKCQTVCQYQEQTCQHCLQVFCQVCWPEHVNDVMAKLSMLNKQLDDSELRLNHKLDDFNEYCRKLNENINAATENKIIAIRNKQDTIVKEIRTIQETEGTSSNDIKEKISEIKKDITKLNVDSLESETQKIAIFLNLHNKTSELLEKVSCWGDIKVSFDEDSFKLDYNNDEHNFVEEDETQTDARLFNATENGPTLFYRTHQFTAKLFWNKCPRPSGVGIAPWSVNHLYVASIETKTVLILDRKKTKVIGRLGAPNILYPHSLAFNNQLKEVYVTDKWNHCVHVFSNTGVYLRSLCSKGNSAGKIRSPEGIAVCENGNELVVCDTGNDRIVILDPLNGNQLSVIGIENKQTEFNMPTGVAVRDDKIYIADSGNNRIKQYNMKGYKLMEIGSWGREKGQFRSVEVVTVDRHGFILAGDSRNARIQVFNPEGVLVKIFGTKGTAPGKFQWISGIAVTEQLEIITTDYKNRCLQIF